MISLDFFPTLQHDRSKETIRRDLMNDVVQVKIVGISVVLLALVTYLLTASVLAYILVALAGVAALHILAFRWAAHHLGGKRAQSGCSHKTVGLKRRGEGPLGPILP